jgi:alpha-L-fucosidase
MTMHRSTTIALALALSLAPSLAQLAGAAEPLRYATEQVIAPTDTPATIAEKAAKVLPRANQAAWMRLERTFFLHFGVNTFNQVEWGSGRESPALFNPAALDARQWLQAVRQFDGKLLVLVAKHHDGFAMWPSRYTAHSTAASPWRGGHGDLVREVADAARAAGVKLGIYLSPADLYQLRTNPANPAGYYGNGSAPRVSAIPTDPDSFLRDPARGRAPAPGFGPYTYKVNDYNRYFLNQLYELLTAYGPVDEVWFDGANPDPSVAETYDYAAWYDLIRKLQPQAVIMGKGPDVRWVGTESGYGRTTEWSVVPLPNAPAQFNWPDMQGADLGSRARLTLGSHLWWYPAETNATLLANGQWFWAADKHPRPVTQLVDIFYSSIGRNANLILNLSPDQRGLLPDDQLTAMTQLSEIVRATFATDLAAGGRVEADHAAARHRAAAAHDGNLDSWWEAAPGHTTGTLTLRLPKPVRFDVVSLQEAVKQRGQRIESFAIDTWIGREWVVATPIASDTLTTVGQRRLVRLATPQTTDRVRIRVTAARYAPTLAEIGLYLQSAELLPPTIDERGTDGTVRLSHPLGGRLVYTMDGSAPVATSPVYAGPLTPPPGGTLRTARLLDDGRPGVVGVRSFIGLSPRGWQLADNADAAATRLIDGAPDTFWESQSRSVTVDMGTAQRIAGVAYLPRQDGQLNGTVEHFRFDTSEDGVQWHTAIERGFFANVRNNPDWQQARFAPVTARYFRFTALDDVWRNGWTSGAELSAIPADRE